MQLPRRILDILEVVPSGYLRYFYAHDALVEESRRSATRGQRVADIEQKLLALYSDPAVTTKPELLTQRGGAYYSDAAVELITSLAGVGEGVHVADVRNLGTLPFLPDGAVVEVPCHVDTGGARPLTRTPARELPPELAALISRVAAYEELAVEAARLGGYDRVFRTLLAYPLIGQVDPAETLTERLLAANDSYLDWVGVPSR